MSIIDKVISIAENEVGYVALQDPAPGSKYGRWMTEVTGDSSYSGPSTSWPWCAMFASWVMAQAGVSVPGMPSASCGTILRACQSAGLVISDKYAATRGDLVIYDWAGSNDGPNDHIGIVHAASRSQLDTIEGNTSSGSSGSQGNGGRVAARTRDYSSVQAIIRPDYSRYEKELPANLKRYNDLDPDAWYIDPLDKAVGAGILSGNGDKLRPNDTATRAEVAAMFANYMSKVG